MQIGQYLTEEHRKCDQVYAEAEQAVVNGDWEAARRFFEDFKEKTLLHFRKEEEILFPEFTAAQHEGGADPLSYVGSAPFL